MSKRIVEIRPDKIIVGDRHRQDLGDLGPLMDSIAELGMLQPIVCRAVNEKLHLVAGERRLEACKKLGTELVPVVCVKTLDSAVKALKAERDENECRKPMTPLEMKSLTDELLELERPAAKDRQREHGGTAPGRPAENTCAQSGTSVSPSSKKAVAEAAKAAGWSRAQYQRVQQIERAAEDESMPESVRSAAAEALRQMEAEEITVNAGIEAVRNAKVEAGVATTSEKVGKSKDENPIPKSAAARERRLEEYPELCRKGYTSRQIAERWGISRDGFNDFRKRHGLEPPHADEALGRTRKLDSDRIVNETVSALEGLRVGLDLVDFGEVDPEQVPYWVSSLSDSIRALTTIKNKLKKELTHAS